MHGFSLTMISHQNRTAFKNCCVTLKHQNRTVQERQSTSKVPSTFTEAIFHPGLQPLSCSPANSLRRI